MIYVRSLSTKLRIFLSFSEPHVSDSPKFVAPTSRFAGEELPVDFVGLCLCFNVLISFCSSFNSLSFSKRLFAAQLGNNVVSYLECCCSFPFYPLFQLIDVCHQLTRLDSGSKAWPVFHHDRICRILTLWSQQVLRPCDT